MEGGTTLSLGRFATTLVLSRVGHPEPTVLPNDLKLGASLNLLTIKMAKSSKAQTTSLTTDGRNAVDTLGRSNVNKRGPKSGTVSVAAAPTLTPDGRPMFDTLGRSNLAKRGPKAGVKTAAAPAPALTPDGRSLVDSLGRSNVNKRGRKTSV